MSGKYTSAGTRKNHPASTTGVQTYPPVAKIAPGWYCRIKLRDWKKARTRDAALRTAARPIPRTPPDTESPEKFKPER
jgi:hypothetical protein